jgi:hypothetical protein
MKHITFQPILTLCLSTVLCFGAAKKKDVPVFLTPSEGGADYQDQGEYVNDWGGAQVIALGDNQFRLVLYPGGLPGAGWDQSSRNAAEGKREGGSIQFSGYRDGWSHSLKKGVITTNSDQGDVYTMNKLVRTSPTMGVKPPTGAIILMDGSNADAWVKGHLDARNLLAAGTKTSQLFKDFRLHLEFKTPFKPKGRGQGRGNSGVYIQDRYEVQVLDSFGLEGKYNECGGLYTQAAPAVNMCFPPLTWQTYDIDFKAARFDDSGNKNHNAIITVRHNGVVIHDRREITAKTGGGKPEGPTPGPIQLQGHGNPVFYQNIWILEM